MLSLVGAQVLEEILTSSHDVNGGLRCNGRSVRRDHEM